MSKITSNHWTNYQTQISKYLNALEKNPYFTELKADFENIKITKITNNFKNEYANWIKQLLNNGTFSERWIDSINSRFPEENLMKYFAVYVQDSVDIGNITKLKTITTEQSLNDICDTASQEITETFNPTPLKFVTTTAVSFIETNVDFKQLYDFYTAPIKIIEKSENHGLDNPLYDNNVIGKIIGCKYGNHPIKGFFKRDNLSDFYNCATLNICIDKHKTANVKVFNNGKLQLTGIPTSEDGIRAVSIICDFMHSIPHINPSTLEEMVRIKPTIKEYRTVMINTCYDLGFSINRESLYDIFLNKYKLSAIYDSEGYPGVRVHYFYNKNTVNTPNEGICKCSKTCVGKGTGQNENSCRKLSVAIFQSGSAIIAGGCENVIPINTAYNFINNIIGSIINTIKKVNVVKKIKKIKKTPIVHYILKTNISNQNLYQQLVNMSTD